MSLCRIVQPCDWVDPLSVLCGLSTYDGVAGLLAGAGDVKAHGGRWSYIGCDPDRVQVWPLSDDLFSHLKEEAWQAVPTIGVVSYDAGAREATGLRSAIWPDLILARYPALLVFDHHDRSLVALGVGRTEPEARAQAARAHSWLASARAPQYPSAPAASLTETLSPADYAQAVAEVVKKIGEGELFQANIARGWSGYLAPERHPFDVFLRLSHGRGAAYGAFARWGDRAIVSNSPELFLNVDAAKGRIETRPIKGTRPRGTEVQSDALLARELENSTKDQAENLMIVDLMRNDLARVSQPGSVTVQALCALEAHPTVYHLTSTVSAQLRSDVDLADVLTATFPPGSITGAPKHQAMKRIAALEPPRGVWCGSLFGAHLQSEGDLVASVLIRTASFQKSGEVWSWQALAGAGITADSDPLEETAETEAKFSALRMALSNPDS